MCSAVKIGFLVATSFWRTAWRSLAWIYALLIGYKKYNLLFYVKIQRSLLKILLII